MDVRYSSLHVVYFCLSIFLQNNMVQSIPVRVIRGHKCVNSYSKKVYTYDGLYKVRHFHVYVIVYQTS